MEGMLRKVEKMMEGAQNRRALHSVYNDLNKITSRSDFIYILSYLINSDMRGSAIKLYTTDIYEKVSIKELQFIAGLWLKNSSRIIKVENDEKNIKKGVGDVRQLLDELHAAIYLSLSEIMSMTSDDMESSPEVFRESFFYASEPAYEKQYLTFTPDKYKYDKNWLLTNRNLNLENASMFYWRISSVLQKKASAIFKIDSPSLEEVLNSCCLTNKDIKSFLGFESFLDNLTINYGSPDNNKMEDIGDFNILQERPLVRLPDGRYFIVIPYTLSEALYTSPFYWMMKDESYKSTCTKNRGNVAEEITYNLLLKIFPEESLLKNVIISTAKGKFVTDIDVLAIDNESAVVFQVKSKALTELSRKGNIETIKSDYNKAIRGAYEQGIVSKECLLNSEKYIFSLEGEYLENLQSLKKIYIVTILLEGYPGIIHQGRLFFDTSKENPPISWSIFDLDLIVKYLSEKGMFMDYILKRQSFSNKMMAESESVLLTRYIETGFKEPKKESGFIYDGTVAQKLDFAYHTERVKESLKKVGRNERCPCGSGLKYKRCCGTN